MVSTDLLRTIVGIIGNTISLGLFLSPVPTFIAIWKKRDVEQFSAVPYLATLLNCMIWVLYGLPLVHPNSTLVLTINGAGVVIEIVYISIFLICSAGPKRFKVGAVSLLEVAFVLAFGALVISLLHTTGRRSTVVGAVCIVFCIMMYVAPLSVMKMVIQTKSIEYMPLYLSVASFFNGASWTVYALLRFDPNILIPNGVGLLFSIAQLTLYAIYYKSTKRQMEARRKGEVGLTEVVVRGDANKIGHATENKIGHATETR